MLAELTSYAAYAHPQPDWGDGQAHSFGGIVWLVAVSVLPTSRPRTSGTTTAGTS